MNGRPTNTWRGWVGVVTLGEVTGFLVPAVVGAATAGAPPALQLVAMTAAGAAEGAVLGLAQAHVLRRVVPGFRPRDWVVATAAGAALAWLLGMLPSTTHTWWSGWPAPLTIAVAVPIATILLLSIGTAQSLVLPGDARDARQWIGFNVLGWCVALTAFTLVTTPWWHPGQDLWLVIGIGLVGGFVMAATMAAITGVAVLRLERRLPSVP